MHDLSKHEINESNAAILFAQHAEAPAPERRQFSGKGIVICAGVNYLESAYVVVRLLRHFGTALPIEIWHAGEDEIPPWARPAFMEHDVTFCDIMKYCPARPLKQMRGFPIKTAALLNTRFREVMLIDADCFPVCNLDFLFQSPEYKHYRAVFFPDSKRHLLLKDKHIWSLVGMPYTGDTEFETGLLLFDKVSCWKEINLAEWMNSGSAFWYQHVLGDKDTFYLAWRKCNRPYFLAPDCFRVKTVLTRHYWTGGRHLADHRTGTSKYALPYRKGPITSYLSPYKGRPAYKDLIDECLQRLVNSNYRLHTKFLCELNIYKTEYEKTLAIGETSIGVFGPARQYR